MKFLFQISCYLFLAYLFVSCGTIQVSQDYDEQTDFSQYTSYQYDFGKQSALSELEEGRFIKYTDSLLNARGFTKSDTPSVWISLVGNSIEEPSRTRMQVGVGGGSGGLGVSIGGSIPVGAPEENRAITIEFIDAKRDLVVWSATAEHRFKSTITPQGRDALMREIVLKLFKKYPPQS